MNILWDTDPEALEKYRFALGTDTQALDSAAMVARVLHDNLGVQQVVIGPEVPLEPACELAEAARLDRPELGVILLRNRVDVTTLSLALRSGVREVVTADDHTALADALRRSRELTSRLLGHAAGGTGHEGHIITVFSAKGGVGKTTLSTNISAYLAETGSKTLLVDLDLSFGDVAISLQLIPTKSVFDAVGDERPPRRAGPAVARHDPRGERPRRRVRARTTRATPTGSPSTSSPRCSRWRGSTTTTSSSTPRRPSPSTSSPPATSAAPSSSSRRSTSRP